MAASQRACAAHTTTSKRGMIMTGTMRRRLLSTALATAIAAGFSALPLHAAEAPAAAAASAATRTAQTEDTRLAAFFNTVFERNLADSPIFQSQIGRKGPDYGKWDSGTDAEVIRQYELNKKDLADLHAQFDFAKLSPGAQRSYRIFEFLRQQSVDNHPWRFHAYQFSSTGNTATALATFMQNVHGVADARDAEAYVSRLRGVDKALAESSDYIRLCAEHGVVPTTFSFEPVLKDARNLLKGAPFEAGAEDNPLLVDFKTKVGKLEIADADKQRLVNDAIAALTGPYRHGVENYIATVESVRAKSPGPNGVWALPDGADFYTTQVRFFTTDVSLSPDALHQLGQDEVKRIRGEMEGIMRKVGFKGDLQAFYKHLRTDPANFFPNTDAGRQAYLDQSKAYIDSIYSDVKNYFNLLPKAPLEVRRVEEWREATAPLAFYNQPTPDGKRPGIYYVNLRDMTNASKHEMETVAYHEGAPGHHFQIAIAQELKDVPEFQKFSYFGAYIEGWGLYAERLAKEEGRFTDPMQDFGRLDNEMLRAVRLVVDTGGHARKWTREQMIQYMLDNVPTAPDDARKEVERYLDNPGQALSYKVGMLKILALRTHAQEKLGKRFDIRAFHDAVLSNGAVPLPILEQQVDAYIAQAGTTGSVTAGH
jgi:uncharacterized protein (DUF885 family)